MSKVFIYSLALVLCATLAYAAWDSYLCRRDDGPVCGDYGQPGDPDFTEEAWWSCRDRCADGDPTNDGGGGSGGHNVLELRGLPAPNGYVGHNDLQSQEIFVIHHTGGGDWEFVWTNENAKHIRIIGFKFFIGFDYGVDYRSVGGVDLSIGMFRGSDGSIIGNMGWDHYAEPTAPNHNREMFFPYPYYMLLRGDDFITIKVHASGNVPVDKSFLMSALIYFDYNTDV